MLLSLEAGRPRPAALYMRQIWISITVLALTCSPAVAQSPTSGASCRTFVQTFYNWYIAHGTNFENTLKSNRTVLSPTLRDALLADLAASRKNPDEIVGLDFDPFVNSQDPAPHYRVGSTSTQQGTCRAEIYGVPSSGARPDVTAELALENGNWRFVNFHYSSDNGADNENLISILGRLKRDREQVKGR
jgi:hypothetical protein